MKRFYIAGSLLFFNVYFLHAQQTKQTEHINRLWFAYFNQIRFSDKWGMWADLHLRTKENFVDNLVAMGGSILSGSG